jgi:hypothetical protein
VGREVLRRRELLPEMSGHHDVRTFELRGDKIVTLPDNWKPFTVIQVGTVVYVVCRKWVRNEKTQEKEEPST